MNQKTLSVSVVSGKGGVGKTNLALNLGYALHKAGFSTMLMDCDVGLANLDVLLGLVPERNIQDILDSDVSPREVIVPIESKGFDFIPSASGVTEMIDMDVDEQARLFDKMDAMLKAYDFFLLDLGAGISRTVLSFATASEERIVLITSEPTSLTDGYALIKVLHTNYGVSDFHVVVNMVADYEEGARSFERLNAAASRFLGLELSFLGSVRTDPTVPQAVIKQVPLLKLTPRSPASTDLLQIAAKLKTIREKKLPALQTGGVLRNFPVR